jgi:hypothetical protein
MLILRLEKTLVPSQVLGRQSGLTACFTEA